MDKALAACRTEKEVRLVLRDKILQAVEHAQPIQGVLADALTQVSRIARRDAFLEGAELVADIEAEDGHTEQYYTGHAEGVLEAAHELLALKDKED